ncbi:MAG: hypothetical protein BWY70_01268 [Bacteroidetes bacterium ADurb.Bin408]|nr:MAG: hypothetical protein BWY70_01268 [Bacteroidetes bacterium ADurb.Bin408]
MIHVKCLIFVVLCMLIMVSCERKEDFVTQGYKPIYVDKDHISDIAVTSPVPMVNPGKIYLYNNNIFINERGRGIHVVDNAIPTAPLKTRFISIPGNYDIAIKNNYLYADNASDLVTINISDLNNIQIVNRISNIYDVRRQMYPDFDGGYFECVDTTMGFVVGWYKTELVNPKCKR